MDKLLPLLCLLSCFYFTSCKGTQPVETENEGYGTRVQMSELSLAESVLWANLPHNELIVIHSDKDLKKYVLSESNTPEVDFSKHTLLVVDLYMPTAIIATNQVYKNKSGKYTYYIEIELNDATMIGRKIIATLVPAIPEKSSVDLILKTNQ